MSPFLLAMSDLTKTLTTYAEEHLADGEHFLITVEKVGLGTPKYTVVIDGDKGVSIDACSQLSRYISKKVDEDLGEDMPAFTFEVASPGVDRPLMTERQYPKHVGRGIKFITADGTTINGTLKAVSNGQITVDVEIKEKGKKKPEYKEGVFSLSDIKEPKIIVSFK